MPKKIQIAIVGVGNCASALMQGLEYYKDLDETSSDEKKLGLIHPSIGGYLISDIEVVAAFDVNVNKVGRDIAEAIWVYPNNAKKFADVPLLGVKVSQGFIGDGVSPRMRQDIPTSEKPDQVRKVLKESRAEMLVSFLPVGSEQSTAFYAQACLDTGVAFINGMPSFIASVPEWTEKFREKGIPVAGDDVMSQVGATIVNKLLKELAQDRGQELSLSIQLNEGGNADFKNMQDAQRVTSKKISKVAPLKSFGSRQCQVIAVPAGYNTRWGDTKVAIMSLHGNQFGGLPFHMSMELVVEDSPNSAGVIADAIRLMKLSLDRGLSGYQEWSAYYFKSPMRHMRIEDARRLVEEFIG